MLEKFYCLNCSSEMLHDGSAKGQNILCPNCGANIILPGQIAPKENLKTDEYSYKIYGQHPVQADGRVLGHPFYFRAKWNFWDLTICLSHDFPDAASWIDPPDGETGYFRDEEYEGFRFESDYGTDTDASFMNIETAKRIIEECLKQFVKDRENI